MVDIAGAFSFSAALVVLSLFFLVLTVEHPGEHLGYFSIYFDITAHGWTYLDIAGSSALVFVPALFLYFSGAQLKISRGVPGVFL